MTEQSEHSVAVVSYEGHLKRQAARLRHELKPVAELLSNDFFIYEARFEGRCDGELKIKHNLAQGTVSVSGDTLEAVLEELKRRAGWQKTHDVKALPDPNDIPF